MKNKSPVFDILTHFITEDGGDLPLRNNFSIEGFLSYVSGWQNPNLKAVNLLAGACPKYEIEGKVFIPSKWEIDNGEIKEFRFERQDSNEIKTPVGDDCYEDVNILVLKRLKQLASKYPQIKFLYSPMIHPKHTTVKGLERLVAEGKSNILGLKIHGISSASGPVNISEELARAIAHTNIPLIIHTDYNNETPVLEIQETRDALVYLQGINNPRAWVEFCLKYNIRASLQHCARNDKEVFKIMRNNAEQFTVGIGPKINGQGRRIAKKTDNPLLETFEDLGPEYCLFCSDYPHNSPEEDLTREVEELLSENERKKVFSRNATNFFGVNIN